MRTASAGFAALLLGACAHSSVSVDSRSGIQVSGNAMAAVLATGVIVAGTLSEREDPNPLPDYRSMSGWFWGPSAAPMDPSRPVIEQDCTKRIQGGGNLRCK